MKQLFINFDANAEAHPDLKCEETVLKAWDRVNGTTQTLQVNTSTENLLMCTFALIAEGKIPAGAVGIMMNNEEVTSEIHGKQLRIKARPFPNKLGDWLRSVVGF